MAKAKDGQAPTAPVDDLDAKIADLEAAKQVIGFLRGKDKSAQERILNTAGDILDCWTKRVRRTKAELAAEGANGSTPTPETPVPAAA